MSHFGRFGPPDVKDTYSLLVLNITFRTTADDLHTLFDKYGKVVDVFIARDRRTGESRGFAYVRYKYQDEVQKAVERLDGKVVDNREIMVRFAKYDPNVKRMHRDSHRDRDYCRRSPSRSRDRYDCERYHSRDRDHRCRSRRRSRCPDYQKDYIRAKYESERRSCSRYLGSVFPRTYGPSRLKQHQPGDQSYAGSSLNPIGQDNTINCILRMPRASHGTVASLNQSYRFLVKSGEIYKWRRKNDVVEHWVYFCCEHAVWEAMDLATRRWMHLPRLPCLLHFKYFSDKESLGVGTQILYFGTNVDSDSSITSSIYYKYNLVDNSWSPTQVMNSSRHYFGSASLAHVAILAGGRDVQGEILSSAELYDSELETWTVLPNMNKPRFMCSGVFMDNKFYVIGGIGRDSTLLTCGEEFDMQLGVWTEIPNMYPVGTGSPRVAEMPRQGESPPLVAVSNNELYTADYADMEVRKYMKETRTWSTVGRLPESAGSIRGWGIAFKGCGDRLIVVGGYKRYGPEFLEVNACVPTGGQLQWELLGRKSVEINYVYNCADWVLQIVGSDGMVYQ